MAALSHTSADRKERLTTHSIPTISVTTFAIVGLCALQYHCLPLTVTMNMNLNQKHTQGGEGKEVCSLEALPPSPNKNRNLKSTDLVVHTMISNVLRDLPFSQNHLLNWSKKIGPCDLN